MPSNYFLFEHGRVTVKKASQRLISRTSQSSTHCRLFFSQFSYTNMPMHHVCVIRARRSFFISVKANIIFSWWAFAKFNKQAAKFILPSLLHRFSYTHLFYFAGLNFAGAQDECDLQANASRFEPGPALLMIKRASLNLNKGVIRAGAHKRHLYKIHSAHLQSPMCIFFFF